VVATVCEDRVLGGPASEDKGPYALTPNTVELIPTLGAVGGKIIKLCVAPAFRGELSLSLSLSLSHTH